MTERKPPELSVESWVDKQVREAAERGEFDNLPGAGKPLPNLNQAYDELWWVKDKMRREGVSTDALLPTPLQLRKEIERLPGTMHGLPSERAVRDAVQALNRRIAEWLRAPSGPYVPIGPVNVEQVVEQWRTGRQERGRAPAAADAPHGPATRTQPASRTARWWQRVTRRRQLGAR